MMKFSRPGGGFVVLMDGAEARLKAYAHAGKCGDGEAGGILIGRLLIESDDILIDEATEPGKKDRRRRFTFWRSTSSHQKRVDTAWKQSRGTQIYLGEWHSHPEADPTPSNQDVKNWLAIIKDAKYEQDQLLFAIAGIERIRFWQLARGKQRPQEMLAG